MTDYVRIHLATSSTDGERGPLPPELVGLDLATLADLPAALDPVPAEFDGVGYWPVDYAPVPDFDPRERRVDGHDLVTDLPAKRVTAAPIVRDLTVEEVAALPPVPVLAAVTMRQARLALLAAGVLDDADAAIGAMTGTEGRAAQIEWEYATELRRDHPLVDGLGKGLGLGREVIDALFVQASRIG